MNRSAKAEAAERIAEEIARRRERGEPFQQLQVASKRGDLCGQFWGRTWCNNLEAYSDYEDRLPRGKSYLRGGNIYDLTIDPGEVFAYVTGAEIYEVLIKFDPLPEDETERIQSECAGKIGSVLDLLSGKLGDDVMSVLTDLDSGLIPKSDEIHFTCTCPDWADMCKHIAATLYAVGVEFDHQPELLFKLRQVDYHALISAAAEGAALIADVPELDAGGDLTPSGLSALFGIEISEPEAAFD
ncbi:MAG: SWIM zinc finger family protein [Verrucomicrobiota bacterium]